MSKKRPFPVMRLAMMAIFSILLLFGSAASLTYALFYNEVTDNTAKIQAGDLKVTATYVSLEGTKIDTDPTSQYYGRFIQFTESKNTVLSEQEDNIFDIKEAAPRMTQVATFKIKNEGSIAFDWEIRLCDLVKGGTNAAADTALSKQILIKIESGTESVEFILADYEKAESSLLVKALAPNAEATFTVTATFLDDVDVNSDGDPNNDINNMEAINGSLNFDITILATQSYDIANP